MLICDKCVCCNQLLRREESCALLINQTFRHPTGSVLPSGGLASRFMILKAKYRKRCNIGCVRWRHCLMTSVARMRDGALKRVKGMLSPHCAWIIDNTSQQVFKDVQF